MRKIDPSEGEEFKAALVLFHDNDKREALVAKACMQGDYFKSIMPRNILYTHRPPQ